MGKAINELDSFAGPVVDGTLIPVAASDTLKKATASQLKTYMAIPAVDATPTNGSSNAVSSDGVYDALVGKAATGAIGSSGLTMATAKLLGRSTAGTGAPEEITLGTNLSFTGTTLNAAGGGGTPGGSNTQLQYNNAGAFGGASGITTTGTELAIASGTKTASAPPLTVSQTFNNSGVVFSGVTFDTTISAYAPGSKVFKVTYNGGASTYFSIDASGFINTPFEFQSGSNVKASGAVWAGTTLLVSGGLIYLDNSADPAIKRNAAGVVEINNGSAGAYRDLKLRNLIGTGNLATGTVAKTADYTATTSDGTIEVDASGAVRTITLFAASGNAGKILVIKKTDSSANAVTIDGNASETIDGTTTISLASQYSTAILQVNAAGTGWNKLGGV